MIEIELQDYQAVRKLLDGIDPDDLARLNREIDALAVGDHAKVGIMFAGCVECPWVKVTAITAEGFTGTIDNDLIFADDEFGYGSEITFERRHIHSVMKGGE